MSSSQERTTILYAPQHWIAQPSLASESAIGHLDILPSIDEPVPDLRLTRREFDALIALGKAIVTRRNQHMSFEVTEIPNCPIDLEPDDGVDSSIPELITTDEDNPSLDPATLSSSLESTKPSLLDVRASYRTELGPWPSTAEALSATHMTGAEQARAVHYQTARQRSISLRATTIAAHKAHVQQIRSKEADIVRFIEQGELHRQDAVRLGEDMNHLCTLAQSRAPIHPPGTASPLLPSHKMNMGKRGRSPHAQHDSHRRQRKRWSHPLRD